MSCRLLLTLILSIPLKLFAQGIDPIDVERGIVPNRSYSGGLVDSVNLANGSLNLNIPLYSLPQKGKLKYGFQLLFSSNVWYDDHSCQPDPSDDGSGQEDCWDYIYTNGVGPYTAPLQAYGLSFTLNSFEFSPWGPGVGYQYYDLYSVVEADGQTHAMTEVYPNPRNLMALDGSGITAKIIPNQGTSVTDSSGVTESYLIDPSNSNLTPFHIQDIDGNVISESIDSSGNSTLIDSLGRDVSGYLQNVAVSACPNIGVSDQSPSLAYSSTYPGANGGTAQFIYCYTNISVKTNFLGMGTQSYQSEGEDWNEDWTAQSVLQSITLPDGTFWGFVYDNATSNPSGYSYGNLNKLIYPSGATVQFYWSNFMACLNGAASNLPQQAVIERDVTDVNGNVFKWLYNYGGSFSSGRTIVTDPNGNDTVHSFSDPFGPSGCYPSESEVDTYGGSYSSGGQPLKTVSKVFQHGPASLEGPFAGQSGGSPVAMLPIAITTAQAGNTIIEHKEYNSFFTATDTPCLIDQIGDSSCNTNTQIPVVTGNVTRDYISDSGGSIQKDIRYVYEQDDPGVGQTYRSAGLFGLIETVQALDAYGNQAAKTSYFYDEPAYLDGFSGTYGHLTSSQYANNYGPDIANRQVWLPGGTLEKLVDGLGHVAKQYVYGSSGGGIFPTASVNALGQQDTFTYDLVIGKMLSHTDPNMQVTSYTYDNAGRLWGIHYPDLGQNSSAFSVVFCYSSPTTLVTTTAQSTFISLPSSSNVCAASTGNSRSIEEDDDGLGHTIHRVLSNQANITNVFDGVGNLVSKTNPYQSTNDITYGITAFTYDALGRMLLQCNPDNGTAPTSCAAGNSYRQWIYSGNSVSFTDEAGRESTSYSDILGRLGSVQESTGSTTTYTYDVLDNLQSVTQSGVGSEQPRIRSFKYDSLSRLLNASNPESGVICYGHGDGTIAGCQGDGYDSNGNLLYKTDANGNTVGYTYDALNRVTNKSSSDGLINDYFGYDWTNIGPNEVGRLSWADHIGMSGTFYNYDSMGRVDRTTLYAPNLDYRLGVSVTYDLAGNPTNIMYSNYRAITQTFDSAGRLATVIDTTSNYPTTVYFSNPQYTAAGALSSATYGNGVTETITYNNRSQPCHTWANSPAVPSVSGVGNVYDRTSSYADNPGSGSPCGSEPGNNGNIAYIVDNLNPGLSQTFTYDGLNRLQAASRSDGGYNHTYIYDSFGNMILQDNLHGNPNWSIDPTRNQLLRNAVANVYDAYGHPLNDFTYDYAGNLVSTGTAPVGHTFTYNVLNQIIGVDGGSTGSYNYDASDRRVYKQVDGGAWTDYFYLGEQPMSEYTSDGAWADYIYANGMKIAKVIDSPNGTSTVNYYLDDHLGTTQFELDASGNVTWQGQFAPFGQELDQQTTAMHYMYTGKERDQESGLDYFGARYYASSMGRWMSPDWSSNPSPIPFANLNDPQSLNLYNYVENNPLTGFDPYGHLDCSGGATQDVACAVTTAAKAVWHWLSGSGGGDSTPQGTVTTQETYSLPQDNSGGLMNTLSNFNRNYAPNFSGFGASGGGLAGFHNGFAGSAGYDFQAYNTGNGDSSRFANAWSSGYTAMHYTQPGGVAAQSHDDDSVYGLGVGAEAHAEFGRTTSFGGTSTSSVSTLNLGAVYASWSHSGDWSNYQFTLGLGSHGFGFTSMQMTTHTNEIKPNEVP